MKYILLAAAIAAPTALFAAGTSSTNPPKPTGTTTICEEGMVYDTETKVCVTATQGQQSGLLNEQELMDAVREFAYAGQFSAARDILPLLDPNSDFTQTYMGFTARKLGDMDAAIAHYEVALASNPDNLSARSYMGQAHVELGDMDAATVQLAEIKARGGTQTWPAISLSNAIRTGRGYSY
ncbi:MAG: tetratricopeptide repeat protein [Planktomarina sp.]